MSTLFAQNMALQRPPVSRSIVVAVVAGLLALHAWLALSATIDLGFTADETAHLTGGYSYWRFNDYRLQPENGNLPQRWAALPLLLQHPYLEPAETPDLWQRSHVWLISQHFLFESGNNTDFLLFSARAAMVLWSVATGLLVFFWSRRMWGETGALLSLALYSLSPTTLAHGPLVTSDLCATFFLLAATGAWWRLTKRIGAWRLGLSLAMAGLAAVAKFSCVLLLPIAAAIALWRVVSSTPIALGQHQAVAEKRRKFILLVALGAAHVAAAWCVIWAFFGFRYSAFAPDLPAATKFFVAWPDVMPPTGTARWFFEAARRWHILPDAYLQGFAYVLHAAQQRGAFAAGHFSTTGWWWFFPYTFLVKSSIAELLAAAGVLACAVARWARAAKGAIAADLERVFPLIALAVIYGAFSICSHLNIGHRHILPVYPVLFILAGGLARSALRRRRWLIAGVLAAVAAIETFSVRPHFLAFFNRLCGGPESGWRHLVDSSLDWGQNLPRLSRWLRENRRPNEPVYVSSFGSDDPFYHGVDAQELAPYYSFGRRRQWVELKPGLYCIGATMLQDVYSPFSGPWTAEREAIYQKLLRMMRTELANGTRPRDLGEFGEGPEQPLWNLDRARFSRLCLYLRERPADAAIGSSILIYRLSAEEVRVVVDGSFLELAAAANAASATRHGN